VKKRTRGPNARNETPEPREGEEGGNQKKEVNKEPNGIQLRNGNLRGDRYRFNTRVRRALAEKKIHSKKI